MCLLLCCGYVCYCVVVVCNCVGDVFVIVWGVLFVIVWGLCFYCLEGHVCYCVGVLFVIVIFVWLLKFNNMVLDEFGVV